MTYLMTTNLPHGDLETYRRISERVEAHAEGLVARYAGETDGGIAITTVWTSKAHSDRFTVEHLMPAVRELSDGSPGTGATTVDFDAVDEYHAEGG